MGFESQEAAERWYEAAEFRAEQLKEERMLATVYTGRERRWMQSRAWSNWTDRMALHDVVWAAKEARELAILDKMREQALSRGKRDEHSALYTACHLLRESIRERRKIIASECAPWFDGSIFSAADRRTDG